MADRPPIIPRFLFVWEHTLRVLYASRKTNELFPGSRDVVVAGYLHLEVRLELPPQTLSPRILIGDPELIL